MAGALAGTLSSAALFGGSARRIAWQRLRYQGVSIGRNVYVGRGVTFRCTDGGSIIIRDGVSIANNCQIIAKVGGIDIGRGSSIGHGSVLCALDRISIGAGCRVAEYVTIRDQDHLFEGADGLREGFRTAKIRIGDGVWLGAKVTVTKGVEIGNGCVVGANAVVTHSVAADSLAAGCPARVLRSIDRSSREAVL